MRTKNLRDLKSLQGTLVAKATPSLVSHKCYSFVDKQGKIHFIPAANHQSITLVLEGKKVGGFNSSRLKEYIKYGYSYSETRKKEINQVKPIKTWDKLFNHQIKSDMLEIECKTLEEIFLTRVSRDIVK